MQAENNFYDDWKKTVSPDKQVTFAEEVPAAKKAEELFEGKYNEFKNQFIMSKGAANAPVNKYVSSIDFQSSNNFYHEMTNKSINVLKDT